MNDAPAVLTGSCLCGAVAFEVDGPIAGIGQCHCSLCRKVSGTASNAVFVVASKADWETLHGDAVRHDGFPTGS